MRTKILKRHLVGIQKDLADVMVAAEKRSGDKYLPVLNALDRAEAMFLEIIRAGHDIANPSNGNRAKTHCPSGHEYSGDNVKFDKRGFRQCRTCEANYNRQRYADNRKVIAKKRRAAWIARKTHCSRGHPLQGANVYLDGRGARRCRKCRQNGQLRHS